VLEFGKIIQQMPNNSTIKVPVALRLTKNILPVAPQFQTLKPQINHCNFFINRDIK
jgi:hypothetical protein